MKLQSFYQRHHRLFEIAFWPAYLILQNTVGAVSVLREYARDGRAIASWEPFVWEYSSAVGWLILLVPIVVLNRALRDQGLRWPWIALIHLLGSFVASILHVTIMVGLRQLIYFAQGRSYDFGDWSVELLYEYRKDVLSYLTILVIINVYPILRDRWLATANAPSRLVSRKQGREYPVDVSEVLWARASGNYVNLHTGQGVFPVRMTMRSLTERLPEDQFVRIHRSLVVRIDEVKALETLENGDGKARLGCGEVLPVSRTYRAALRKRMGLGTKL